MSKKPFTRITLGRHGAVMINSTSQKVVDALRGTNVVLGFEHTWTGVTGDVWLDGSWPTMHVKRERIHHNISVRCRNAAEAHLAMLGDYNFNLAPEKQTNPVTLSFEFVQKRKIS